jgi:hypothetical protein
MNRKLNYVFSQVIDNYKNAYKGNSAFYIGFGLLFIAMNAGIYILDFNFFKSIIPEYNTTYLLYAYLLLLILPCLATLKQGEVPLKFWQMLGQNVKMILAIIGLALVGFSFMGVYGNLFEEALFASFNGLFGIVGNLLSVFIILFLLRSAIQNKISFFDTMKEAFFISVLLFAIIQEFESFFSYGLMGSFRFIFGTDFGEIVLTPVLFLLVNLLLSPLLVSIMTTLVRYENNTTAITETSNNEAL